MLAIQAGHYAIMQVLTRRVQFSDNLPLINQQPAALFSPLPNRAQSSYVPQYFPVALVQEQFINEAVAVLPSENRLGYANPPSNNNNNQEPEQDDFFEELFDMIREGKVELFYDFLNMIEGVDLGSILDREGNTLLHLAAQLGRADFVQRLIQAGANINTLNQAGDTPAVLALHAEHFHVVQLFTRGGQGLTNLSLINQRSEASIFPAPSITQSAYLPQGSVFLQVPTQPINGEDVIIDYRRCYYRL